MARLKNLEGLVFYNEATNELGYLSYDEVCSTFYGHSLFKLVTTEDEVSSQFYSSTYFLTQAGWEFIGELNAEV